MSLPPTAVPHGSCSFWSGSAWICLIGKGTWWSKLINSSTRVWTGMWACFIKAEAAQEPLRERACVCGTEAWRHCQDTSTRGRGNTAGTFAIKCVHVWIKKTTNELTGLRIGAGIQPCKSVCWSVKAICEDHVCVCRWCFMLYVCLWSLYVHLGVVWDVLSNKMKA